MNCKFFIFPYTQNSAGAIALAEELEGKRVLRQGSSYKFKDDHCLINWGASDCPYPEALNRDIKAVLDKRVFFDRLKGTGLTPAYATSLIEAKENLFYPIYCRTKVKGHDGQGIVIADNPDQLVSADLYTQGVDKAYEYRIHVGRLPNGEVVIIGGQKKIHGAAGANTNNVPSDDRIWCGDTTRFVWTVSGFPVHIPMSVQNAVLKAFDEFPELTFGAFDAMKSYNEGAYVLEINSAPMMTPETAKRYGSFFRTYVDSMNSIAPEPEQVSVPPSSQAAVDTFLSNQVSPVEAPSPTLTVMSIMDDLNNEKISLKTIIEGYIAHVS